MQGDNVTANGSLCSGRPTLFTVRAWAWGNWRVRAAAGKAERKLTIVTPTQKIARVLVWACAVCL